MPYKDREKQLAYWREYSKKKHKTDPTVRARRAEYTRRYRERHPERSKESHRKWYYAHHEHAKKYSREWHKKHYARRRDRRRLNDTGVTPDMYAAMLEKQNHRCAICGGQQKTLRADHNHATGKVRGLLCFKCNYGIGILGDSIDRLRAAADYLERTDAAPN